MTEFDLRLTSELSKRREESNFLRLKAVFTFVKV
jgi:hypothetical protein